MARSRIVFDSSAIITALLSTRGGAYFIFTELSSKAEFITNEYEVGEIREVIKKKFGNRPEMISQLYLMIGLAPVSILENPSAREKNATARVISSKDAPILASAVKHANFLLTLDNEFFGGRVERFALKRGCKILKPRELVEVLR